MQNEAAEGPSGKAPVRERGKNKVLHPEFAYRLGVACDSHPQCPPLNHGRLGWFCDQIARRFGKSVTTESVRRWLSGEARPRPATLGQLATILQVEEAWLSVGASSETEKERRAAKIVEKGATTVLAGLVQMCGGSPAFPSENDARAKKERIDLYAIIRGAQYAFHVSAGVEKNDTVQFSVPVDSIDCVILGAVLRPDLMIEFFEIPLEIATAAPSKSGQYIITVEGDPVQAGLKKITTLSKRL